MERGTILGHVINHIRPCDWYLGMLLLGGIMERGTILGHVINHIRSCDWYLDVSLFGCVVERRPADVVLCNARAGRQQPLDHPDVSPAGSEVKRARAVKVALVYADFICHHLHKERHAIVSVRWWVDLRTVFD